MNAIRLAAKHVAVASAAAFTLVVASITTAAPARPAAAPHVTRTGQVFTQLEESLLQAIRGHDEAGLQALIDDEFEMVVAQAPDAPVAREDWLANVRKTGAAAYTVADLSVREIAEVAVASFVLRPSARSTGAVPLFVVDTWQRDGAKWRLTQRHIAPVAGSRRGIPGDSGKAAVPKQI